VSLSLAAASESDSEFVYDVNRLAMREYVEQVWGPWEEERQRAFHGDAFRPADGWFLIDDDGVRVGVVQYDVHEDHIWLGRITITPQLQGRGIGSAVIERLRRESDGKPMRLRVLDVNVDARRLYERLGFVAVRPDPPHLYMEAPSRS
jgi:GNAT superfamily N-acetyltransferase